MIKVLVLDDDKDLVEMVCLMLTLSEIKSDCINDATALLSALSRVKPDMLLMDIFMGDQDGRLICKELKSSRAYSTLPVLLYSASDVSPESLQESGADDFLAKPFQMEDLIGKVQRLAEVKGER